MKKLKIIFVLMFLFTCLNRVSAQKDTIRQFSLEQTCQMGIDNNADVQNERLEQEKVHYKLEETRSKILPQVNGYSTFNYYYSIPKMIVPGEIFGQSGEIPVQIGTKFDWSSGFKASQLLYNQSYFTSLKIARQMETLGKLNLQQKKEEVVYQVSQLYYLCQTTKKQIAQLEITLQNSEKLLRIAKLKSEKGVILKVDYLRVAVSKANLQSQKDGLVQLYHQQLDMLKYLIGLDVASPVELSDSLSFKINMTSPEHPNLTHCTELQLLDHQIESVVLTRKMNQQSYLPTLSGFGHFYYQGQRNQFDFFKGGDDKFYQVGFVGINLEIPIFNGLEKRAKIRQTELQLMQLQNTRKSTVNFLSREYSSAVEQYNNNLKVLLRQKKNIEVAQEAYDVSLKGYRQDIVALSDLLMSDNGLTEARLSYYNALLRLKNAELDIRKARGELIR